LLFSPLSGEDSSPDYAIIPEWEIGQGTNLLLALDPPPPPPPGSISPRNCQDSIYNFTSL